MKKIVSLNSSNSSAAIPPASTGQPPLLDLPDGALFKHFDSLDIRSLVQFSSTSKEALSLVQTYFGHPDKKVDLSAPSIRHKITDDSLKLFSECKHINLSGCRNITDAGLAHLTQARDINLYCCTRITDAGLAQFKILNPTCKIYGNLYPDIGIYQN